MFAKPFLRLAACLKLFMPREYTLALFVRKSLLNPRRKKVADLCGSSLLTHSASEFMTGLLRPASTMPTLEGNWFRNCGPSEL